MSSFNKSNKKSTSIIFGKHPVICALNNPNRKSKNLYITKELWNEISSQFPKSKCSIHFVDKKEIEKLAPQGSNHQNILLEVEPLNQLSIEDIISQDENKDHSCLVILDQVSDPHNIGAILRSAAAFSISAIILPDYHSPKENNTIIKCAAGATETIPMISVTNISQCIKALKQEGYWVIGMDGNTSLELKPDLFSKKTIIVLGSEEKGMRKLTRDSCDYIVKIPISSSMESLNVSNAAAIAMYEFHKTTK